MMITLSGDSQLLSELTTTTGNFDSGVASAGTITFIVRPIVVGHHLGIVGKSIHAQSSEAVTVFRRNMFR